MKTLKNLVIFALVAALTLSLGACQKETEKPTTASDERVLDAIEVLAEHWCGLYDEWHSRGGYEDRYLEIINTRIVNIKSDTAAERFRNIDYIVEFELLSNGFDTSPYYANMFRHNNVVVYKDGTKKVEYSPITLHRTNQYETDFSGFIESIEEFHGEYDQILELK